MTWDKYSKDVQGALKENPMIMDAIRNCRNNGHSKEYAQRVTGAPYEVVDKIYKQRNNNRADRDPDGND